MNAAKRVENAVTGLVLDEPFYASLILRLKLAEAQGETDTMCTEGTRVFFNPDFVDQIKDGEIKTVLCEETLHVCMGHLWRAPAGCNWPVWNLAADQEARWIMCECNELAKNAGTAQPFAFPFPEQSLPSAKYRGMAAEAVYADMTRNKGGGGGQKPADQPGQGPGQPGGQPGGNQPGQKPGKQPGNQPGSPPDEPDAQGGGQNTQPCQDGAWGQMDQPGGDQADKDQLKRKWEMATIQAARVAKGRGNLPGAIKRLVEEIIQPKADPRAMLRDFMMEIAHDDWCWTHPNVRYADSDLIMPSLRNEKMGKVYFATDTSGSINGHALAVFQGFKQEVLDSMCPTALVDLCCDTQITSEKEYTPGDIISKEAPGGGGTDFRPVFDRLEKEPETPLVLVYLTDLDGQHCKQDPGYPVLWVTWEKKPREVPFGTVIQIEQ